MSVDVEPPELAQLLDFAERPRHHDWSLRAALTRYAQPQPQRASDVIELMRRIEFALRPHADVLQQNGHTLWAALPSAVADEDDNADAFVVEVLRAATELDRFGDALVEWAHDPSPERPDALVDVVTADVAGRLERLGIAREERPPRAPAGRAARGV